ncbi:hypothetical protein Ssed_3313 [Shewanella sediminis HAW-EB3]|uniref:Uncharacterized protein n=1 Tax=Shewanella sediminis (strain HAW-EB3) TaxID=425104 RepID=A8FYJ4_SHESH|nr:hypothetical protein [Shewanella sediminis]ABV37917.1 hypothetical protein Ssed_3313 [Shewanella sediminis HAW-EB3]
MKFIKALLKGIIALVLLSVVAGVSYYFYDENEQKKKDEKELSYATDTEWVWHDKYHRIQIREVEGKSILRKANLRKGYVVYVYKNEDYSLSGFAKFVTPCSANKEIETADKFSDGTPKKLKCNEKGDALLYSVKWNGSDTDFTWEESLGGFSLRENFTYWDFSKLDQEVTLAKAQ